MRRSRLILEENFEGQYWVVVELFYSKGGHNYFHGQEDPRGYALSTQVEKREQFDGYGTRQVILGSGFKKMIKEAKTFNQKAMDKVEPPADLVEKMKLAAIQQHRDRQG